MNSGAYKFLLVLHILAVIVGFGGLALTGLLASKARSRGGREGVGVAEAAFDLAEHWSSWFIYAVPVLGIIVVLLSDDTWKFSQTWVSISFALYIVAVGVMHAAHFPNLRRMNALLATADPASAAELERCERQANLFGALVNLLMVAILFLMVWKPGV